MKLIFEVHVDDVGLDFDHRIVTATAVSILHRFRDINT